MSSISYHDGITHCEPAYSRIDPDSWLCDDFPPLDVNDMTLLGGQHLPIILDTCESDSDSETVSPLDVLDTCESDSDSETESPSVSSAPHSPSDFLHYVSTPMDEDAHPYFEVTEFEQDLVSQSGNSSSERTSEFNPASSGMVEESSGIDSLLLDETDSVLWGVDAPKAGDQPHFIASALVCHAREDKVNKLCLSFRCDHIPMDSLLVLAAFEVNNTRPKRVKVPSKHFKFVYSSTNWRQPVRASSCFNLCPSSSISSIFVDVPQLKTTTFKPYRLALLSVADSDAGHQLSQATILALSDIQCWTPNKTDAICHSAKFAALLSPDTPLLDLLQDISDYSRSNVKIRWTAEGCDKGLKDALELKKDAIGRGCYIDFAQEAVSELSAHARHAAQQQAATPKRV